MRKPAFCICENKDADQLRGNCEADQHLCFRYTDSTIPLLPKSEISIPNLAISCGCTAWFVSELVGNPEDRFSQNEAHIGIRTLFLHFLVLQSAKINYCKNVHEDKNVKKDTSGKKVIYSNLLMTNYSVLCHFGV